MEYTPSQFVSLLNPCDYNHTDLPFVRIIRSKKRKGLISARQLKKLQEVRKNLEMGWPIIKAIELSHIGRRTFYDWLEKYHEPRRIKGYFEALRAHCEDTRNLVIESAFYSKLAKENGSGAEYEFFLCNRIPERWKKLKDHSIVVKTDVTVENNPNASSNTFTGEDAELVADIRAKLLKEIPPQ